jgi:hypothetical protein
MRLEWIFPIIVLIFYVLGAVMKAREEAQRPKRAGGGQPGKELDRFLEEIERLRREQAGRAQQERDESPQRERPLPVRPPLPPRPVVSARPPVVVAVPVAPPTRVLPVKPLPPPAPVVVAATSARSSPNLLQPVIAMLRNPRSLAAAVILHEVLSPPKGRRPSAGGLADRVPSPPAPPAESTPEPRR